MTAGSPGSIRSRDSVRRAPADGVLLRVCFPATSNLGKTDMQISFGAGPARLAILLIIGACLAACGGGDGEPSQTGSATQPPTGPVQANRAPSITGAAITTVSAGQGYSFQPSAADADGDTMHFSVTSMPSWATLDAATGRLTGAPTGVHVGSYEEIEITVSDGHASTKLAQFAITVTAAGTPTSHAVTLSWVPPTENTDGTVLTDLSGYRILYGVESGQYTQSIELDNAGLTRYVVENLVAGEYFFALVARTSAGMESSASEEVSVDLG